MSAIVNPRFYGFIVHYGRSQFSTVLCFLILAGDANRPLRRLLQQAGEISKVHVAFGCQCVVHCERGHEVVACLPHLRNLQIFAQQRAVVRMSAVLDDKVRPFYRRFSSQVGHALLCHDYVNVMFGVVMMAHHGHY